MKSSMLDQGTSNLQCWPSRPTASRCSPPTTCATGMAKIADDLSSHYVLGYYTNNTRWDGGARKLTVQLKSTGKAIRARREYRAPTEEEMAGIRNARSAAAAAAAAVRRPGGAQRAVAGQPLVAAERVRHGDRQRVGDRGGDRRGGDRRRALEAGRRRRGACSAKDGGEPVGAQGQDRTGIARHARPRAGRRAGPLAGGRADARRGQLADSDTVSIERRPATLLGKPLAYRAASAAASAYKPLAAFQFRRTERVRLEWPVLQPLESHQAQAARSHRQADGDPADHREARRRRRARC